MTVEVIWKAAAVAIVGAVLALLLQKNAPEMSLLLTLAVGLAVTGLGLQLASEILEMAVMAADSCGLSPAVVRPVFKCTAVGLVTHLTAQVCRDAGQGSIAVAVEGCGVFAAVYISLPLIRTLLTMIGELA